MKLFRPLRERKLDAAADEIFRDIEKRHGSPIVAFLLSQLAWFLIKKLLERIIENRGADLVGIAEDILRRAEEESKDE